VNRGGETELAPATLDGLRGLWPRWARLFSLTGSEAEVLAFRLVVAQPPSARSRRCPVDEILQITGILADQCSSLVFTKRRIGL
jgi:hypothetical protein